MSEVVYLYSQTGESCILFQLAELYLYKGNFRLKPIDGCPPLFKTEKSVIASEPNQLMIHDGTLFMWSRDQNTNLAKIIFSNYYMNIASTILKSTPGLITY